MNNISKREHVLALQREVSILTAWLEPHETGHIITTINMLKEHIKQLEEEISADEQASAQHI